MEKVKDPVRGMLIDKDVAQGKYHYKGKNYYFCNISCYEKFRKEPEKYLKKKEGVLKFFFINNNLLILYNLIKRSLNGELVWLKIAIN